MNRIRRSTLRALHAHLQLARHLPPLLALLLALPTGAWAAKPVCGDGVARGGEQCDGADFRGESCQSQGFDGGTLSCTAACTLDSSGCTTQAVASCGDDIVDGFEECDGLADSACPGLCSSHCACPSSPASPELELHYMDVGQGDGILIVSPDGFSMLVDSGDESQAGAVAAYLASISLPGLDYTLVSHMHADHMGAMDLVLVDHPETVACFDHGAAFTTNEFDEYVAAAGARRTEVIAGSSIDLGPSVTVDVLHADVDDTSNENLNSVVFRVNHGDLAFLLGGDCESPCEAGFNPGKIEVYKVHHHGSADSSSDGLLSQMDPYTAVISVGAGNSFGHPTAEALDRLDAHQADIYRTDLDGDIVVRSDGVGYTVNGAPACAESATRTCGGSDVGLCELGTRSCTGGMWGACAGEVTPVSEDCGNTLDDDCDGLTDGADPDCAAPLDSLVLAQVGYDTPGTDSVEEFVDLYNPTASAISLDGWAIADASGSWSLPAGHSVGAGAYLSIARDAAGFSALYGLDPDVAGMTLSLNNSGDALWLLDDLGGEADHVAWEGFEAGWTIAANIGDSIERADPSGDSDSMADWSITSPASPRGGAISANDCGNGVCEAGEDCISCAEDCIGRTNGSPSKRYCCGNGACEPVGEDVLSCSLDCE